ncbi:sodium:proton antiporter [Pilimelia anulata]|uniref:Sodium:proton antiporter n=1 Tax=Pilimelia anulata TaxID=53371 RepID=A0A8J3BBQ0_9ACTN|nr:sodium:proton antiporter [Pilimelia anulata]
MAIAALRPLRRTPLWAQLLAGLVAGVLLGLLARGLALDWLTETLARVGAIFVQLLKLAVPPLVFTAIVVSVAGLRGVAGAARLAVRTLGWFALTALLSVAVGIGLGLLLDPGRGLAVDPAAKPPESAGGWTDFLTGILPSNAVGAFVEFNVLQIVFLAIVTGAAALAVGDRAEPFLAVGRSVLEIVQKALWWVIRLAPIGVAGLIGRAVASYGWDLLAPLTRFTVGVYVGSLLVLFGVYPLILALAARLNPVRFYAGAWPALELAFVSRSSLGTLPVSLRAARRLGVPRDYASFAVPFGATTKMDGCAAVYPALAAILVARVFGVDLGLTDYLLIAFVAVVGSAATAGLTGAIVMLTLTLSTLGLPLAGVALLLAIDPILDMIRTATNVGGQLLVPVVVAARAGILDRAAYDGTATPTDPDPAADGTGDPARTAVPVGATPADADARTPAVPDQRRGTADATTTHPA